MIYQPSRVTPLKELAQRAARLQAMLREKDLDGAVIMQNADLFYFAGTTQRSHLFIPVEGEPALLVRKNYERARLESGLRQVWPFGNLKQLAGKLESVGGRRLRRIGMELDVLPANLYFYYQKLLAPAEIIDVSGLIRQVRAVKSPYEIEIIRDAASLNRKMFSRVKEFLREGVTEVEFASRLEAVYRQGGHQGFIRMRGFNLELVYGHLMSGWNLAVPSFFDGPTGGSGLNPSFPQGSGFKKIARDEPVMVDYVGVFDGYMVDQGRIFCIGTLPPKMVLAYNVALEVQEMVKERARPGAAGAELYESAMAIVGKHGLKEHFMGYPEPVAFIGHGVGIELDELPVLARGMNAPLEEGMVFALEPKFVFPEGAVGIENTFLVTRSGLENLTVFDESIGYLD
ncbi:MAG: Xaa-Pro peptidase family protein [Syntrophomonadaceae bacterium]|nr:Xaa-Pro peptidase family protein [Syntrophomonadaceae bacterium]